MGWVQTPTYVSWVPLAPGEIYYGHGNYGPHSVNITNVNITNIQVTRVVYKNVHVHNAVTIVHHDTFITGKRVDVKVKENPFLRERISIGRPDIKPQRATLMPVVKEIPQAKRPPEAIREIRVKELKERRPFVRDKNASVLTPASPVRTLPVKTIERPKPMRERVGKPQTLTEGIEKPKLTTEGKEKTKPMGEGIEKPKATKEGLQRPKPIREGIEKPKLTKEEIEKPNESKPVGGAEKTRELKRLEKREPKERKSVEKRIEKSSEHKPSEKESEKPGS